MSRNPNARPSTRTPRVHAPVVAPAPVVVVADAAPVVVVDAAPVDAPDAPAPDAAPAPPWYVGAYDAAAWDAAIAASGITDAGVIATLSGSACRAIAAGIMSARNTADTADAVDAARVAFDAAASAIHAPTSAATVNVGRYMGRKIMDGQNVIYAIGKILRAPDMAMAVAWRAEWPGARCNFAVRRDHVASTRPVVNRGGHGWTNGQNGPDVVAAWGGRFVEFTRNGERA